MGWAEWIGKKVNKIGLQSYTCAFAAVAELELNKATFFKARMSCTIGCAALLALLGTGMSTLNCYVRRRVDQMTQLKVSWGLQFGVWS